MPWRRISPTRSRTLLPELVTKENSISLPWASSRVPLPFVSTQPRPSRMALALSMSYS